ncbi:MAG: DUF4364 family protein [Clostridiales bacterium]|nr:DUF4364 family protein [Clostridiales bacterium]
MLDSSKRVAEHKLILLYIIDNFELPLSNIEIMEIVLKNKFMSYFVFQEILSELCSNSLVVSKTYNNKTYYSTTPDGEKSLDFFGSVIPKSVLHKINTLINIQKESKKLDSFIFANYEDTENGDCNVVCRVSHDTKFLIDLKLNLTDTNIANTICANWKKYFQEIYPEILEILTKKRSN